MSCRRWIVLLAAGALFASCEPRTVEIQGLDELTAEIRSQRLLNRQRAANGGATAGRGQDAGAQIQTAMTPLRDVLTQLGTSQRELSARQATLTQEMRRWTQLLVQSMQSERSDEASKLSERLAELEKTIAAQDERHRQVEELLGSALDHTADQLEQFLKRVGGDPGEQPQGKQPTAPPDNSNNTGTGIGNDTGNEAGATPTPAGGVGSPEAGPANSGLESAAPGTAGTTPATSGPPASAPATGGGDPDGSGSKQAGQRGSMAWLWGLAVMSLVSGFALLFSKRRSRPVAMAPEMQFAPEQPPVKAENAEADPFAPDEARHEAGPAAHEVEPSVHDAEPPMHEVTSSAVAPNLSAADALGEDLAISSQTVKDLIGADPNAAEPADTPEVEELWAAAALLGEAIGRLKQTDQPVPPELGGPQPLPATPDDMEPTADVPGHANDDEVELDDLFVIEDDDDMDARMFGEMPPPPQERLDVPEVDITTAIGTEFAAAEALSLPSSATQGDGVTNDASQDRDALTSRDAPDDATTIPAAGEAGQADPQPREPEAVTPAPELRPEPAAVIETATHATSTPPASGQPAARHASSSPVTCRLLLSGDEQAESRVRSMLGRDPRVLISPAPQVRTGMGELDVSFALLPGLTAGERSLLEQQLRDTVA